MPSGLSMKTGEKIVRALRWPINVARLVCVSTSAWYVGFERGKLRAAAEGASLGAHVDMVRRRRAYARSRRVFRAVVKRAGGFDHAHAEAMVDDMFGPFE